MRNLLCSVAVLVVGACQPGGQSAETPAAAAATAAASESIEGGVLPSAALGAVSSEPRDYSDGRGGTVRFPLGDVSFADEVVAFVPGEPHASDADSQPGETLGAPNYAPATDEHYVTLGCGGVLTLRFTDNALADGPGPDLYVFEIGPLVEAMSLAISANGADWVEVGAISGGRADVDISAQARPGDVFHYVRLTDGRARCDGEWPGADVDAVGAVGGALQFSLNSEVLFDSGRAELRPAARAELDRVAGMIGMHSGGRVTIEGHTDGVGADAANLTLSQNRARSVQEYLQARTALAAFEFTTVGYGESRPVASNENDAGKARNRRVDVVLQPLR